MVKPDFPPLLAKGWHPMSLAQLCALCVEPFPDTPRRRHLFAKLEGLVAKLGEFRIPCVLWVDGGMLTRSPTPTDMDVVLEIKSEDFDALSAEGLTYVRSVIDKRTDEDLDIGFLKVVPKGHPEYDEWDISRSFLVTHFHWNWSRTDNTGVATLYIAGDTNE